MFPEKVTANNRHPAFPGKSRLCREGTHLESYLRLHAIRKGDTLDKPGRRPLSTECEVTADRRARKVDCQCEGQAG